MVIYVVSVFLGIFLWLFFWLKDRRNYWKNLGVYQITNVNENNARDMFISMYKKIKSKNLKYAGHVRFLRPNLLCTDLELIKHIIQIDHDYFMSHGVYYDEKHNPLSLNLFNLEGSKWKSLRAKLTPTFTSGKMKMMFQVFMSISKVLEHVLRENAESKDPVDIKDILARFTTDIIGNCAFGLECNSLKEPNVEFREYGKKTLLLDKTTKIKAVITNTVPKKLLQFFVFSNIDPDVEKFFMDVVRQTVKYREENNIYRKDFLHLLLQLKNIGKVTDDGRIFGDANSNPAITMNELAAQCFVFFIAGFETSSTTMTFALYELAVNQEIQEKLRNEIRNVLNKYEEITYEAIMEMNYLEKVLQETLRKYPPLPILFRKCTKAYTLPGTNLHIKKDMAVTIPIIGLHYDSDYYPDPEKFDPERFNEENKAQRPAFSYLPFGDGPRICIGLRFGLLQSKVGLITLLKDYKISLNEKTETPLKYDPMSFLLSIKDGIWLDLQTINEEK